MAPPLPRRSRRLGSLSPEVTFPLHLRRCRNRTDPLRPGPFAPKHTILGSRINTNWSEEPQVFDGDSDRDSLEHPHFESPIREGSPPISEVVPYPPLIQETPPQVQASLSTPLVGLPFPSSHNFREFDFSSQTAQLFPMDWMATGNPTQNLPPVVMSVTSMVGPSLVA